MTQTEKSEKYMETLAYAEQINISHGYKQSRNDLKG